MKCKYCGSNLGIEDEVCPYCGKLNEEAAGHQAVMETYREEFEKTKTEVKKKSISAGRLGRLIVIGLMLVVILFMGISIRRNSDVEYLIKKEEEQIAREVEKNRDSITAKLQEMEKNREYIALDKYNLRYRLRSNDYYEDYFRVFTATIDYTVICEDIMNILSDYDGYHEKTNKDWCYDIAIYISHWRSYVEGEAWFDSPDSPMYSGEHGAFISDAKKDAQDIVQVYFNLTDEQASSMWDMEEEELGKMLYENCRELYPEGGNG